MNTKRYPAGARDDESRIAARDSNCVAQNRVSRAARFPEGREEEEIRCRSEGWENKRIAAEKRQKRKQSDGDEAVYEHVDRADEPRRKTMQQPIQPEPAKQGTNVIRACGLRN